jgi:Tfp pilus assembly protein PilO
MTLSRRILTEKRRLIYPLTVAIVINAAVYAAVVYPLAVKASRSDAEAEAAAKQVAVARLDYDAARATVSGKAAADVELQKFYGAVLPRDESSAQRISILKTEQLSKAANVTMDKRQIDPSRQRESALGKLTVTLALRGEYEEIRQFIYELETAAEFLVLEHLTLSQAANSDESLNVSLRIATYYRAGDDGT